MDGACAGGGPAARAARIPRAVFREVRDVYRWVDHTAELELELEAESEAGVFEEALAALGELLAREPPTGEAVERQVSVKGSDSAVLLADWLAELAYLAESQGFVPERAERIELADDSLSATVAGRIGDPPHLVKAVTYHRLQFAPAGEAWRARVVLDV